MLEPGVAATPADGAERGYPDERVTAQKSPLEDLVPGVEVLELGDELGVVVHRRATRPSAMCNTMRPIVTWNRASMRRR